MPDLTPLINNTATSDQWSFFMQFITWNDRKLYEYVDKIDQSQQTSGTTRATDEGTSRISTELTQEQWTLL